MEINKIYNEDCLITMSKINDCSIDLTVTSPPYDNLRTYNGFTFDFESIAKELYRVTKDGGVVVWVVNDATINGGETGTSFKQALFFMSCGFNLHDTMIWHKHTMPLTHNRYEQHFEYMFVFTKGKPKTFNAILRENIHAGKKISFGRGLNEKTSLANSFFKSKGNLKKKKSIKGNVWNIAVGGGKSASDNIAFKHPAIFPEQLANDHIISWSNENDIIYDPFCGSGTVPKMCLSNNRNYIGSEISKEYCEIIEERLNQYKRQTKLF